jgi:periplasmic protein CpxP/Spy
LRGDPGSVPNSNDEVMGMVRFSASTAYLAAVTFLGAVALPVSMDLAATQLNAPDQVAQAGSSTTAPGKASTHVKHTSVQRGTQPTDRVETHIKELHSQLKITPDQEDKWNAFAQVMRENAQAMQSQIEQRVKNQQNMNALDDLTSYEQITETHAEGVKRLVPAFQALYDSMSPEQKKNADMVFARYGRQMAAKNGMSRTRANGTTKPQTQTQ